jgi:hypothetical protein
MPDLARIPQSGLRIFKPGFYPDLQSGAYFADPCPSPSLTQSLAKVLLEKSPLHAWHAHPRLNPDYRHDDDTKFDVGNVAHKLMIGRGKELEILDAPDWKATGMGKGAMTKLHADRDAAREAGKVPVLGKTVAKADRMVRAAREQLDLMHLSAFFAKGDGEVVLAWKEGDLWLRQMVDWLTPARDTFIDYKTSDMSAAPDGLGRVMVNAGWPIQAAMAERGLNALLGPAKRQFFFVMQETDPPYSISVARMSNDAMTMGGKQLARAVEIWAECVAHNIFPGYPPEIVTPEYPGWHEQQWLERETRDAARARLPRQREEMLTDLSGG